MMDNLRMHEIEVFSGEGNIEELRKVLEPGFSQLEIDVALENAIAYSQIKTAEYLLTLGADFSNYEYQGVYYAVHNNELEGLKFAILKGVDINLKNGILLNTGIDTAIYTKSIELVKWLLNNGADKKLLTEQSLSSIKKYGNKELKNLIKNAR